MSAAKPPSFPPAQDAFAGLLRREADTGAIERLTGEVSALRADIARLSRLLPGYVPTAGGVLVRPHVLLERPSSEEHEAER